MPVPTPPSHPRPGGLLPAAAVVLALGGVGCAGEPADEDLLRLPPLRISSGAVAEGPAVSPGSDPGGLADGTFRLPGREGQIQLRDGSWEDPATGAFAQLYRGLLAHGDFDGDGLEETAALLSLGQPGARVRVFLLAVGSGGNGTAQEATLLLGAGVQPRGLRAVDGAAQVRMLTFGPEDDPCCPSRETTRRFRIRDGSWTER